MAHGSTRFLLPTLVTMLAAVVSRAQEPAKLTPRQNGDLAIEARAILRKHCHECHGGKNTRTAWSILEHSSLIDSKRRVPFVSIRTPEASQIIQLIEDGSMPQGRRLRPTQNEILTLKKWIAAGAPSYPAAFDESYTLNAISADLPTQGENAMYFRYISFAHLLSDGEKAQTSLVQSEADLQKALDAVSEKPGQAKVEPVDSAATLFRLDLRQLGWNDDRLFYRPPKASYLFTAYDVLLLEYPYGTARKFVQEIDEYLAKSKMARPIPFLRGDWVASALLAKDGPTPLAQDLKSLTELHAALKSEEFPRIGEENSMPCGSRSRPFGWRNSIPAAMNPESQSPILPLNAWYLGDVSAGPPPFELKAELVDEQGKPLKSVQAGQKFQLKVNTKKGVKFTLLMVNADSTIRPQPTNMGGVFQKDESLLTPGTGSFFNIDGILTGEQTGMEYFVLLASESEQPLPAVTIFRSRHANWDAAKCTADKRFPVWRFQFDLTTPPKGFDPAKVVRRVIPISIESK